MVMGETIYETDVVILGGGPGGYTAGIRAADLGKSVIIVESNPDPGGVCLKEGCITSKTLINAVELAENMEEAKDIGLIYKEFNFDIKKLRDRINAVVKSLSDGIKMLFENRDIDVVQGYGRFTGNNKLYVEGKNTIIQFKNAIIATGSHINKLPKGMDEPVWTSKTALELPYIPKSLLVIGGGYIGLEIGQAFAGLKSDVTLMEFNKNLLSGADKDLVNIVLKKCKKQFKAIHTESAVTKIVKVESGYIVSFNKNGKPFEEEFEAVLAATGRKANTQDIGLDIIGIEPDESGLIQIDEQCRTKIAHIFAVGDITPGPALAHKAARQGKVAAEVIAGLPSAFDNIAVPAVLFTSPQISWTGLTEEGAIEKGIPYKVGKFPLSALGRAKTAGKTTGFVKILADPESSLILGVAIVGEHASEMISEGTLAIEMGACLEDLIVSIHPHPTFSESLMEAAEMAEFGSVHQLQKKKN
jgi:dihydrolipoamide dehydrogenase